MGDLDNGGEQAPPQAPAQPEPHIDAPPIPAEESAEQPAQQQVVSQDKISDEVLKEKPADGVSKSTLRLKYPRQSLKNVDGTTMLADIDLDVLKSTSSAQYDDFQKRGIITTDKDDKPSIDVYAEWGGTNAYTDFVTAELQKPNGLFQEVHKTSDEGFKWDHRKIPKEHVTAEMIANAHNNWLAQKMAKEAQDQVNSRQAQPLAELSPLPPLVDATATAAESEVVDPAAQQEQQRKQAEETKQQEIELLQARLEEAIKLAEASQKKVDEDNEKRKKIKQENKIISDAEALNLLNAIKAYSAQEQDFRKQLKTASPEKINDLEEKLSEVRRQKAEAMLKGIGYSEEDAAVILSRKNNLDTDLALFLRLAKHTSLSKEQDSPNIAELNRVVKVELLQSIADLLNKEKPEDQKQTFEQVRVMRAGETLRAAMKALGFDEETQNKKVKELVESANSPERKLNVSEDDPLHTMIESLVSGKPSSEMEKDAKSWFKKMEEEFREAGGKIEDFPNWLEKKINEVFHGTYNPEFAESIGLFFTMLLAEYLDVGAFMEMLLVGGDHFSSLAHDLGYKSKEQLLKEGKHPIDEHDVDAFIRKNDAKATNARDLLCAGLEDIIPKDVVEQYLHNTSPSAVLKDDGFVKLLEKAFSKEYHEKFSVNLLKTLGYTEKAQEGSHITLTNTAMTFIMSLPEVAKHGNWTDGGESDGGKRAEGKGGETGGEAAKGDSAEKPAAQPSGAAQAEQPTVNQSATPLTETKTS